MVQVDGIQWYRRQAFGEDYLNLYRHRGVDEAAAVADLIRRRTSARQGGFALDVGCGFGRHLRFLGNHNWTVGVDLSASLLRVARQTQRQAPLVLADMRELPFPAAAFDLVVNLFTSFGYFHDDANNLKVISEVSRVTAKHGWFVLDFLNAAQVRRTLVDFDRYRMGGYTIEQRREISQDGHYVQKNVTFVGPGRTYSERVRLFDAGELICMFNHCGFEVRAVLGDYQGNPFNTDSPRAIVFGQRS